MMSLPFHSQQLATVRDAARILIQRTSDHEDGLQALVAATDMHVRHAEDALCCALDATHGRIEHLQLVLSIHLQRIQDVADTIRQLRTDAHDQRVAAGLLLMNLRRLSAEPTDQRVRRDAVLVVDDQGDIREVVAEVLRGAGLVVRTAANGLEGLLAAYEMRPSVIVMDVTMPVLDGIEATRLIKAAEATRQARVIAYTGNPELDETLVRTLFSAVVQKPATPATLLAAVRHVAGL